MNKLLVLLTLSFVTVGLIHCAGPKVNPEVENILPPMDSDTYVDLIEQYTHGEKRYSGFYNTYQVEATMLNSKVMSAVLQRRAHHLRWSAETAREEREKVFQEMSSQAEFFLSFYSPDRQAIDLDRRNSIWKIYLEVNGERHIGEIKKSTEKLMALQTTYPHHTRFNTGYSAIFKVPMTSIENSTCRLILTSSLGTSTLEFKP